MHINTLLMIIGFILFLMQAFGVSGRVAWGWLGAAVITLTFLI